MKLDEIVLEQTETFLRSATIPSMKALKPSTATIVPISLIPKAIVPLQYETLLLQSRAKPSRSQMDEERSKA